MNETDGARTKSFRCVADIADHTGYHFHTCGKPAKWIVGAYGLRCGLHARGKWYEAIRKPIKEAKA